ncbi:hypothetical protein FB567DRAFT_620856 [Paraphoma chrysanthemicola]|uniref:SET domain-containing protein n=1 Tax=Paraphoma chrysanthemicola TaxID=798071 RepID=A0A8K0VZA0_9PLEO|nr:hypothetical protein FB567DRAFT_620856 [Paraphoma chrysanthemicola]
MAQTLASALKPLPNFTYTKTTGRTTRSGKSQSTTAIVKSVSRGRSFRPKYTPRNIIIENDWDNVDVPDTWPSHLIWPHDIHRAFTYDLRARTQRPKAKSAPANSSKTGPSKAGKSGTSSPNEAKLQKSFPCHATNCPKPKSNPPNPEDQCTCTIAPWDTRNTFAWFNANVSLVDLGPGFGIGTIAQTPFPKGTMLGEYTGLLVPDSFAKPEARYLFDLIGNAPETIAYIDSLRAGNWTRFINHSCRPNTQFELVRVGREVRVCVHVVRNIEAGEEVTIGYGKTYWGTMAESGIFCGCGEKRCRFKRKDEGEEGGEEE